MMRLPFYLHEKALRETCVFVANLSPKPDGLRSHTGRREVCYIHGEKYEAE